MAYNRRCDTVLQTGSWQCSAASAAWVLRSVGISWGQDDVVAWLGGHISPALGLHEGSGRMLAELFRGRGLNAGHAPLSWERAHAMAGQQPFCMSGAGWYHWSGVRGTDGRGLQLTNPAPGWRGVGQYLDRDDWERLGPWNAAWVTIEDKMSEQQDEVINRLRGELAMRTRRDEELIGTMGYIHGEILAAYRHACEGLRLALDTAQGVAPLREDIRGEAYGDLEAIKAATKTLEVHTRP
jgi:hypothetical protein